MAFPGERWDFLILLMLAWAIRLDLANELWMEVAYDTLRKRFKSQYIVCCVLSLCHHDKECSTSDCSINLSLKVKKVQNRVTANGQWACSISKKGHFVLLSYKPLRCGGCLLAQHILAYTDWKMQYCKSLYNDWRAISHFQCSHRPGLEELSVLIKLNEVSLMTPNNRDSKYMKWKWIELQEKIDKCSIIVRDFNTSAS